MRGEEKEAQQVWDFRYTDILSIWESTEPVDKRWLSDGGGLHHGLAYGMGLMSHGETTHLSHQCLLHFEPLQTWKIDLRLCWEPWNEESLTCGPKRALPG